MARPQNLRVQVLMQTAVVSLAVERTLHEDKWKFPHLNEPSSGPVLLLREIL